jgi:hypothetical protein
MAICSHLAPNGEKSLLYDQLEQKYGPDKAHDIWTAIHTQQFLNEHGDWAEIKRVNDLKVGDTVKVTVSGRKSSTFDTTIKSIHGDDITSWVVFDANGMRPEGYSVNNETGDIEHGDEVYAYIHLENSVNVPLDTNQEPTIDWVQKQLNLAEPTQAQQVKINEVSFEPTTQKYAKDRESEQVLTQKIQDLYSLATANPGTQYKLNYTFGNEKLKSGYSSRELANLLDQFPIPQNVILPEAFYNIVQNSSKRIIEQFKSNTPVEFLNRNEEALQQDIARILVPKVNANGQVQGYFTPVQYQEITDSLVSATRVLMNQDPALGANALIKSVYIFDQKRRQLEVDNSQPELRSNLEFIYNQRVRFAEAALKRLSDYGLSVDDKSKAKILKAVQLVQPLSEQEKKDFITANPGIDADQIDEATGEFIEAQGHGLKDWNDVTFELDPKDTASARIKMFIATLPETDRGVYKVANDGVQLNSDTIKVGDKNLSELIKEVGPSLAFNKWKQLDINGLQKTVRDVNRKTLWMQDENTSKEFSKFLGTNFPLVAKENFLGMRKLVDFEATFNDILELLADKKQDFDEYMNELANSGRPNLQFMVNEMRNSDPQLQNEFMKVMSKQYQNFTMVLFNKTSTGFTLNPINANRYSQKSNIIKSWQEEQKLSEIMIINQQGERVIDIDRIREKWIPILAHAQRINDWSKQENVDWAKKAMGNILRVSGIDMTESMLTDLFKNMEKWTKGKSFAGGIGRQFSVTQAGEPNGIFSSFIMKAAGMSDIKDINVDDNTETRAEQNNPLYTENSAMQVLASVAAKYTPVLHSSNHRSSEGKNVWDFGLNTKLSHKFRDLVDNFSEFKATTDKIDVAKNNWLMNALTNNPQYLERIDLAYLDGVKPTWSNRGTTRDDMSDREQMLTVLSLFQNQGNGFNKVPSVHYMSLTHSDKTTTPIFMNMPKLNMGAYNNIPEEIIGNIGSAMYNVFSSEHQRITKQSKIDFNNAQYDQGKKLFYFIPEFNYDSMKQMVQQGTLTPAEFKSIWMDGQRVLTPIIRANVELPVINKILNLHLNNLYKNTLQQWTKLGIVTPTDTMFDKKYNSKLLYLNGIKYEKGQGYKNSVGEKVPDNEVRSILVKTAVKDFAWNYFLFNTSMSQLMYGDPALTYKAAKGKNLTDIDHVNSTMKEYAKRLAKDIAPGQDPYWLPNEKSYNTITLADVISSDKYLKQISENLYNSYSKVEGTDAQELTTVEEHLRVMRAMGTITTITFNQMLDIINKAKGGYYEFTNPDHLAIILQPMKPVYSGTRTPQDGAQLEDYIKSSSYPLYPPAVAGTEMDKLRTYMEKNQIARANFASAKKIGNPTNPLEAFTKDGKFIEPDPVTSKLAQQVLSRDGFRIQQEVPYDEDKETIRTVSQMNKLIVEGIGDIKGFEVPGHGTMDGTQVRALKEAIRKEMIKDGFVNFKSKFNVDPETLLIQNKNKVYDMLADEAEKKGYTFNERQGLLIRDKDGELAIPLVFNTAADKLESMMMSMVKGIVDVKVPGKSFIQASSVGYTFTYEDSIDKSQVVWLDGYDGTALKTLHLNAEGKIQPAQVLVPFNFTDGNGNKLRVEDFMIERDGKRYLDTDRVPKELIQMVGARIPNQGHNSMLPIEIVGFLPSNAGDLIIVPSAITKQMGADFDVDKLFCYRRPYNYHGETNSFSSARAAEDLTVPEYTEDELQTAYFDVHYSILTHPDMISKILNPLDKPDLREEAAKIKVPPTGNYFDINNQLNDFQSGKDAKALVGMTSLSVTFNSVIQDKNLHLIKLEEDGKGFKMVPDAILVLGANGETIKLTSLSGNGTSEYNGQQRTKHDNHTTVQSAAVDNAKDRTLDNLDITTATYKALDAMNQLQDDNGYALDLGYGIGLLTQPIIREFDSMMKRGNDSLSEEFTSDLKNKVFEQLEAKYSKDFPDAINNAANILFNAEVFDKTRNEEPGTPSYAANQIAALNLFKRFDAVGQRKSEIQSIFNQDTNGAGPNILSALDKLTKQNQLEQPPIGGTESLFATAAGVTEQAATFSNTITPATVILTQVLPYQNMTDTFTEVQNMSGRTSLSIDQQRNLIRAFRSLAYTSGTYWFKDAQAERVRLFYNTDTDSLAKRVLDAKRTWGKDNYFLQRLDAKISNTSHGPDFVEYQASSTGRIDEEQNVRAWLDILMHGDDIQRHLGEDLLRYAFLTGGIQDATSFVKFVPVSYIANTEFGSMLKEKAKTFGTQSGLLEQYFQHNPELAIQIDRSAFGEYVNDKSEYPETFKVPVRDDPRFSKFRALTNSDGTMKPFASFRSKQEGGKWILYAVNYVGESTYYTRIDTLGNKSTDEYNGNVHSAQRSIFTENRALASAVSYGNPIQELTNESVQEGMKGAEPGYYKGVSQYDKIGLQEGGQAAIDKAVNQIIDNPLVPEYLRSTAKLIADTSDKINAAARAVFGIEGYVPKIIFDKNLPGRGQITPAGELRINPDKVNTIRGASETLLHESVHQRVQTIIMASGFDKRVFETTDPKELLVVKNGVDKFIKENQETVQHVQELDRIRYEAYNALVNQLGADRVKEIEADLAKGEVNSVDHNMVYALSSVQELVAHVMTNSDVAGYLNAIPSSTQKGFLQRFIEKIADILKSFSKAFGFTVKDNSLLKEALVHTISLTQPTSRNVDIDSALKEHIVLQTDTLAEAQELQGIAGNNYDRISTVESNPLGHVINITNEAKRTAPETKIDKILGKLRKQMDDAGYAISNAKTAKDRVALSIRYRELKEDVHKLASERNLNDIAEVGKKQMEWVDKVLAQTAPSATDVQAAIEAANIWSGLTELLYGDLTKITGTDKDFAVIQSDAQQKRIELINSKARDIVVNFLNGHKVQTSTADFKSNVEELSAGVSKFLELARVKPVLAQAISVMGKESANNRDEEINRVSKKLESINTQMKKLGITADQFMQDGTWGLVQRLSNKWYSHINDTKSKLHTTIDALDRADSLTDSVRREKKAEAWNRYWSDLRKVATFVDTRTFFDFKDGTRVDNEKSQAAFKKLSEEVGSDEYAKELVDKAHERFERYIEERTIAKDFIYSQVELSEEDKLKTPEEQKKLLEEKQVKEYDKWLQYNSPTEFLNKLNSTDKVKYLNNGDKWVIMAPKASTKDFYDNKYAGIHENEKVKHVYDQYHAIIAEMVSYLPIHIQAELAEDFLPIISPDTINTMAGMIGKIRNFDTTILNALTATEQEEASKAQPDRIPIMYTRETKRTKDIEQRSKDLIRVAEVFSMMALHYKHMSPVLDSINVAESIVKEVNRQRAAGEVEGKPLRNMLDDIKYFKDAVLFKKPKALEGKVPNAVYSLNPAKQVKTENQIKDMKLQLKELEEQRDELHINGEWETDDIDKKIEEIDAKLLELEGDARNIYGSKVADTLIVLNQLTTIGFSPVSAITNLTFGAISLDIHANGRRDFSRTDIRWATSKMTNSMTKYFTFGAVEGQEAHKIANIIDRVGIMGDIVDTQYGQSNIKSKKISPILKSLTPFNWQRSGDFYIKGKMVLAMMHKQQVEVTDQSTGEKSTISLYDALDVNGNWNEEKYGVNPSWYSTDISQQNEWNQFRNKARKISTIVFGNQDKNAPLLAKKNFLWRLVGQFRMSWFPEGIATRFLGERNDIELGRTVKGRWVTYGDLGVLNSGGIMLKQLLSALPGIKINPFEGRTDKQGNPISETDIENMRKNFAGLAWTAGFAIAILMIRGMYDDDQKGKKKSSAALKRQLLINLLLRNYQDLMQYSSPSAFNQLTGNIVPATRVLIDYWGALKASAIYIAGDEHKDATQRWILKTAKAFPVLNQYPKLNTMINRDLDTIQK